jgi:hypothetical protein
MSSLTLNDRLIKYRSSKGKFKINYQLTTKIKKKEKKKKKWAYSSNKKMKNFLSFNKLKFVFLFFSFFLLALGVKMRQLISILKEKIYVCKYM